MPAFPPQVIAKEVLEFWGQPVVLNELRGGFTFSEDGLAMQEKYTMADMAGQQNTDAFGGATATLQDVRVTADGRMRIGARKLLDRIARRHLPCFACAT